MYIYIHTYKYTYIHTYIHINMHTLIYIAHICICICFIYVNIYICMYMYIYIYLYIYACICVYIYLYIYKYAHIDITNIAFAPWGAGEKKKWIKTSPAPQHLCGHVAYKCLKCSSNMQWNTCSSENAVVTCTYISACHACAAPISCSLSYWYMRH